MRVHESRRVSLRQGTLKDESGKSAPHSRSLRKGIRAAVTPSSASFALPPSGAVRTSGPCSVSAMECSQCEDQVPSVVMTVQSSSRTSVRGVPRRPSARSRGRSRGRAWALAAAALDVVQQVRVHVHLGADAVAAVVLDDAVLATARLGLAADVGLDGAGDVDEPVAVLHRGDAYHIDSSVTRESSTSSGA